MFNKMIDLTQLRYLPIICVLWMMLTWIVAYTIAVYLDHVHAILPYISDTGTLIPESCIFGIMLNIGSFLMGLVILVRYKQIKLMVQDKKCEKILNFLNKFCLITGLLSIVGSFIVANFQITNTASMHLVGANLCFGSATLYFIVHTILCYFINKNMTICNIVRTILCILYIISYGTSCIYAKLALENQNVDLTYGIKWNSNNQGYNYRLISTFSEWTLGLCHLVYILSFSGDFKSIELNVSFALLNEEEEI